LLTIRHYSFAQGGGFECGHACFEVLVLLCESADAGLDQRDATLKIEQGTSCRFINPRLEPGLE